MIMKLLITTCLLAASLSASAQPANNEHLYDDGFHGFEHTQGFNDRFSSEHRKQWLQLAEQAYISKAQAIDIARQRSSGKILSAKLIRKEQHAFYKIKVLTDQGRIKTLRINAQRR